MQARRFAVAMLALCATAGTGGAEGAQGGAGAVAGPTDLKPALRAEASFVSPTGEALKGIEPGQRFRIRIRISSDMAAEAPRGLNLFGWLRRVDAGDLPCGQAAETFLRTGRLPLGTVFLNDPVIGVATEDRSFIVSDPDFSLASANILGATPLPATASALVSDAAGGRFLLALPEAGEVVAVDALGAEIARLGGLDRPSQVAPSGVSGVLVLEAGGRLLRDDGMGNRRQVADGINAIRATREGDVLAALADGEVLVMDAADGRVMARIPADGLRDAAVLSEPRAPGRTGAIPAFGVALLVADEVRLHYLDAPAQPVTIPLPAGLSPPARRLVAGPAGRVALAWSPEGGPAQVIDIARARIVRQAEAPAAITEIAFSDRSAFLMLASQTHVGALDLQAIARGQTAEFREIQIGTASAPADHPRQLLAPLWPVGGMLAVHAETFQGYQIMDGSVMGDTPAMTATSLRGGLPRMVATLDRSFREDRPGSFETLARLPGPGRFELVATTGLGALSFCAALPVTRPEADDGAAMASLSVRPEGDAIRLVVTDAAGRPAAGLAGRVTFGTLSGSWRASADLDTDAQGASRLSYVLPDLDGIVVRAEAAGGPAITPFLIETPPP